MHRLLDLPKCIYRFGALACTGLCLLANPAQAITQEEAQHTAANTNHHGSDDDQDEAVRNAMMALMNLAALNIPGAFSKGYEAYGNYINSEKLDDLEARTKKLRGMMNSVEVQQAMKQYGDAQATAASKDSNVSGKIQTTLSKLDTGFLYKGQTGQVAEEFEKRSGMKREEFFKHLASATDQHFTYDDPELQGKLEQRWAAFKERIPNKDFRAQLDKAEAMFPQSTHAKLLGDAMAFYKGAWKGGGSAVAAAPAVPAAAPESAPAAAASASAPSTAPAAATAAAESSTGGEQRAPASADKEKDGGVYPKQVGFYIGLGESQDPLKELLQSNGAATDDDSLFKMVSLHYRKLTPALVAQKNVRDAK